eukprot:scaffold50675_cov69-Attheya_sp.AAC.2
MVAVLVACLLDLIALPSLSIRKLLSRGGENVFQLSCPGIGRRWLAERRVWRVGGFRRVVGGGSGLNLVGGPAGAVGHVSTMVWFEVGIGFHRRKR